MTQHDSAPTFNAGPKDRLEPSDSSSTIVGHRRNTLDDDAHSVRLWPYEAYAMLYYRVYSWVFWPPRSDLEARIHVYLATHPLEGTLASIRVFYKRLT